MIAGIGFFLTRFTVTLAIYEQPIRFYLAGVVALIVADVEASLVRTTAVWCVIGAGTMLVLVVLTLLGSTTGGMPDFDTIRSRTYLSNFLIGGSVGGTLTGLNASRNHRQREALRRQTHRLEVLNRLLRHEVLNAVAVIREYARLGPESPLDAEAVIEDYSGTIETTIEDVKYLTRSAGVGGVAGSRIDLGDCLEESVATVRADHPRADITIDSPDRTVTVTANDRLDQVFTHLIENAVVHGSDGGPTAGANATGDDSTATANGGEDGPAVDVTVTATDRQVRVAIADEGPGLPASQQRLLETGEIEEFDDPTTGFGLNVVRLLVESYQGAIETDVDETGTTITVVLPQADDDTPGPGPIQSDLAAVRPATPHLIVILVAALIAGVPYGVVAERLGGSVAAIGVFYGIKDPVVGWLTHQFHSVVFGFVYAGLVSVAPATYRDWLGTYVAVGIGWALTLWLLAAGVVAPVWLRLLGISAPVPNISYFLFWSHLAWGVTLALCTAAGYRYVTPRLSRLQERLGRPSTGR